MGLIIVTGLGLTSSSVELQLEITPTGYYMDAYCGVFPEGTPYQPPQYTSWYVDEGISGNFTDVRFLQMPVITHDYLGNPLVPHTTYVAHCVTYDLWGGLITEDSADFKFTTIDKSCVSGVWTKDISTGMENQHLPTKQITNSVLDLGHTKYHNFPRDVHGLSVFEFPRPLPGNTEIEVKCCEGEECVFWLSLYQCKHCTGEKPNGLATELVTKGWDGGVCSPKFDDGFSTIAYHKKIDANHGDVYEYLYSQYDEIAVMFGIEGAVPDPWCFKTHGPFPAGANCGSHCPPDASP